MADPHADIYLPWPQRPATHSPTNVPSSKVLLCRSAAQLSEQLAGELVRKVSYGEAATSLNE